jgi:hypothetical protein
MTPLTSSIDAAVALAPSTSASAWGDMATIVRFATSPSNLIDARNGDLYQEAVTIPWVVTGNYRVRLAVNVSTPQAPHTYSIDVTAPGGPGSSLLIPAVFASRGSGVAAETAASARPQRLKTDFKFTPPSARQVIRPRHLAVAGLMRTVSARPQCQTGRLHSIQCWT